MRKAVVGILAVGLFFWPASCLLAVAMLLIPAARASCAPDTSLTVGAIPVHLAATTSDGTPVSLDRFQLTRAAAILSTGNRIPGVGRDGVLIALMAALTESSLRMLSNTGAYPESSRYPHDGDGGDHDSLGLFQMRPSTGWGAVEQLMDPTYQARAFFGGPAGPNHGSPRGLLDVPGWRQLPKGVAAQAVEVSAYPDRYARFEPVAEAIFNELTTTAGDQHRSVHAVAETTRVVFPLPAGTWVRTSPFEMRVDPVTGARTLHTGVDLAAPLGTPILAAAGGRVVFAGAVSSGYGHLILIQHTIAGRVVVSGYAHMFADGIHVKAGQTVTAGQHIADVGQDGKATGPHLHFEIRAGGPDASPIDPVPWLARPGTRTLNGPTSEAGGCAL
ncbi:MAG: M23 family metallopeptidase [Nocardioidaceae bacterium]